MTKSDDNEEKAAGGPEAAYRHVLEGHTRDCYYPWDTVFVHADRSVRVCCTSAIIDHIGQDWDLEALVNGPKFREFRKNFLSGKLTEECHDCPIKAEISVTDFEAKLAEHLRSKSPK